MTNSMELKKLISLKITAILAACTTVALSSCQSPLMTAASQGDLATVRLELDKGVPPAQLNKVAAVAYARGHADIVDELLKKGAVAAPDSVAKMTMKFQNSMTSGSDGSMDEGPDISVVNFAMYWDMKSPFILWQHDDSDYSTDSIIGSKSPAWGSDNTIQVTNQGGSGTFDMFTIEHKWQYNRTGFNTAFITATHGHFSISRARESVTYYELTFDSPTAGTFKAIERDNGSETWNSGRFWLSPAK